MLNTCINSLSKNLALVCLGNDANSMLGNTVNSSSFAMGTFVGHSFLNSALMSAIITFLVDLHVCGQRNNSVLSNSLDVAGASPLSFVLVVLANYWKMAVPVEIII